MHSLVIGIVHGNWQHLNLVKTAVSNDNGFVNDHFLRERKDLMRRCT